MGPRILGWIAVWLNALAAGWLIAIAIVISLEVTGRGIFNTFMGGDEIVTNSVPAIIFLQVPLAIHVGTMLRTTILYDRVGSGARRGIDVLNAGIGIALFAAIAVGGWEDMIKGWEIKEYQGIGALEVPVYPIRTIIIVSAVLIVGIYGTQIARAFSGARSDSVQGN